MDGPVGSTTAVALEGGQPALEGPVGIACRDEMARAEILAKYSVQEAAKG